MVSLLTKSGLEQSKLSLIWELVDEDKKGYLKQADFNKAMKYVSLGQIGGTIAASSLSLPTPLPIFKGFNDEEKEFTITADERQKFTIPVDGHLNATQVKDIFVKSNLSPETLGKVWTLIDKDGKFNVNQFIVGMVILARIKVGTLTGVPATLPPGILLPTPGSLLPEKTPVRSNTVDSANLPFTALPLPSATNLQAGITDLEKSQYSGFFDTLDKEKKGLLNGGDCSSFFLKSKLPPNELAQIWELVDTKKSGFINKDGFISAMHLIKKRMTGAQIPTTGPKVTAPVQDLLSLSDPIAPSTPSISGLSTPALAPASLPFNPLSPTLQKNTPMLEKKFNPIADLGGLPSSVPALGPLGTSFTAPTNNLELKEIALREQTLSVRKQELEVFEAQLMDLKPSAEELKKKREAVEAEYKSVTEKRNAISVELSQLRATYEADLELVRDTQAIIYRESQTLQIAEAELNQYKEALKMVKAEMENLTKQKEKQQTDIAEYKKKISELTDEANMMRAEANKIAQEVKQQQTFVDVNMKLLESTQQDYKQVKYNLEQETHKLEQERKRVIQLEQQASVQEAIIVREREKIAQAEKERQSQLKKSEMLSNSMTNLALEKEQISAMVSDIEFPNSPPPAIPSADTKPARPITSVETEPLKPITTGMEKKLDEGPKSASSLFSNTSKNVDKAEKVKRDSMDLDSLLESNKPKKSPSNDLMKEQNSPTKSTKSAPEATPTLNSATVQTPKSLPAKSSMSDFDAAFPPTEKVSSLKQSNMARGNSVDSLDMAAEMAKAFQTKDLKPPVDGSIMSGSAGTVQRPNTRDFDSKFTFDTSFAPISPSKTGNTFFASNPPKESSFGDFNEAFGNTPAFPPASSVPAFPAPTPNLDDIFGAPPPANAKLDTGDPFGSVDFSNAFNQPPPQRTNSPDIPEVTQIIALGFSKEQALNALEIYSFNVQEAIQYLLDSTK
ncbi:hypothetical protein HK103_004329 [Boothiomyces macroporosus]|uniref:Uncharacterized protein n=1 Tax=Boothiomyces macroporosus TaxID=261099 RepID=A0AAD5UGT3_9FUNG|nr:hypothetical protein HK103_004329 [Boothiomyces macroporosus]